MVAQMFTRVLRGRRRLVFRSLSTSTQPSPPSDAVARLIRSQIRTNGPISVADYMNICSTSYYSAEHVPSDDPKNGRRIFGEGGDFVTSPEISQMFGEMLAVFVTYERRAMGHKDGRPWQLVELGGGTGACCVDVLRALHSIKGGARGLKAVRLIERSNGLLRTQYDTICGRLARVDCRSDELATQRSVIPKYTFAHQPDPIAVTWYRDMADLLHDEEGALFSMITTNELFDALPVHQFRRSANGGWVEVLVDLAEGGEELNFVTTRGETVVTKGWVTDAVRADSSYMSYEVCPTAGVIANQLHDMVSENGGAALIVDYGHDGDRRTESLRAYRRHEQVGVLERPGVDDITADVDFSFIRHSLSTTDALLFGPTTQREFLQNLRIDVRFDKLLARCPEEDKEGMRRSYEWLVGGEHMGNKFKAMAIYPGVLRSIFHARHAPIGFPGAKHIQLE